MKKIMIFLMILLFPMTIKALTYPSHNFKNGIVYDLTDGNYLYEENKDDIISIASLTKIATTIAAIEKIADLDEQVVITKEMLSKVRYDASVAGLKIGDRVTYRDLLYASILPSGADATSSLAISISSSIDNFVEDMNELATRIGLKNTHFANVTGLDAKEHYGTCNDILKLLTYALKNNTFREIFETKEYTLTNDLKVKSTLYLYNAKLKKDLSLIVGSKTGFTKKAGYCMASTIDVQGHEIIIIVMGEPWEEYIPYNIIDTLEFADFLTSNYGKVTFIKSGDIVKKIPVKSKKIKEYDVRANMDIFKFLPSDYDISSFKIVYNGIDELSYKNSLNEKIGTVDYFWNDELILSEDIILDIDIPFPYSIEIYIIIVLVCLIVSAFFYKFYAN